MSELLTNWELLAAIAGGLWAAWSFLLTRRRELAWKRTEFIVQQSELLDSDPEMRECTLIVYGKHPTLRVADFLGATLSQEPLDDQAANLVIKFERYLNFLWRIAYAHIELRTLTKMDLWAFGAYFSAIARNEPLRNYCEEGGYDEIVTAADMLTRAA